MSYHAYLSILVLGSLTGMVYGADAPVSFRTDIAPILQDSCLACHGAKKAEGGYRVDSYKELFKAGDSGESPIGANANDPSELVRRISCDDESERMPAESEPLSADQIAKFQKWIAEGAKFDGENPAQTLALVIPPPTYASPPKHYGHPVPITAVAFSPDGRTVISGGYHELNVWNVENGALVRRVPNVGQRVFAMSFSADGKTLGVGCGEPGKSGEVRLIDFATGEVKGVTARTSDVVLDIAFRPGTSELAVASADSSIRIVDMQTLKDVRTIASHADWVTSVAWSDDGKLLASSSRDKSAKVYDGTSGELISSYLGHGDIVRGVSILPENKQVVSIGDDSKLHRWNIADNKKVAEVGLGSDGSKIVRQGDNVLIPCVDARVQCVDLKSNKVAKEFKGHSDWVLSVTFQPGQNDPANELVASGSFDGEVRLWKVADASLVRSWSAKP
ncbi:WD domain, G-beta repeat [Bremerella volcania]|uniref:WD domain, G-beta repeat n=1 Tax=Bremerella volcania TaxID=2527984 RepID=A0A518C9A8_9BACT|nr:c-type cytochrome domain-containing protein [Bremerella volcania]QDU75811.1 WD domain, G-beta repeat [Bremerella volcania]